MQFLTKHPQQLFDDLGKTLFQQLLTASGAGNDSFMANYLPVAERLAMQVQELPLERETFAEQGGALKFGLLSALTTLRLCDSVVFVPAATADIRMRVEPQYRFAAYCASLATVPLIVHHYQTIKLDGEPWSMLSKQPLLWGESGAVSKYELEWKPASPQKPDASLGVLILSRFFDPGQWADFDHDVVKGMCGAINPASIQPTAELALSKVVRLGHEKVRQAEQLRASKAFTPSTSSSMDALVSAAIVNTSQANLAMAPMEPIPASTQLSTDKPIPQAVMEWAKAVTHSKEIFEKHVEMLEGGRARISKRALNHGATAKEMFELLEKAGLVCQKEETGVIVSERLGSLFGANSA